MNILYYGDNIDIMREKMNKGSVDLIYLDPPFKSDTNYNLLYRTMTGKPVPEQVIAFSDTWELDPAKIEIANSMPVLMREHGVPDYYVEFWRLWMNALRHSNKELLAYLIYMVQRLLYMKSLLRPNGSIFLHCDPTASHYIKVMMDAIFGHENFRNEIVWKRTSAHSSARKFGPVHDVILFYSKGDKYTWNTLFGGYEDRYVEAFYTHTDPDGRRWRRSDLTGAGTRNGETGKPWRGLDVTARGRHWAYPPSVLEEMDAAGKIHWPKKAGGMPMLKRYLDEQRGSPIQDVWTDIPPIHNMSPERLGYPTQKPLPLLKRVIEAATKPGDVVFDPFCGCGTTIYAAHQTGRRWIGCDIAILSIKLVREVLAERYKLAEGAHFDVRGIPVSVEQAEMLFAENPFTFQTWLVERVGGFPLHKRGADRGVDGRIYYETREGLREMILSVKGGSIRPTDIRDLRGTVAGEPHAELGGFLCLREPTKAMREAANDAGVYHYNDVAYPRIQILTVREILEEGRTLQTPSRVATRISTGQAALPL